MRLNIQFPALIEQADIQNIHKHFFSILAFQYTEHMKGFEFVLCVELRFVLGTLNMIKMAIYQSLVTG